MLGVREISLSLPHIDDSDEQPRLQVIAYKLPGGGQPLSKERQAHTAEVRFESRKLAATRNNGAEKDGGLDHPFSTMKRQRNVEAWIVGWWEVTRDGETIEKGGGDDLRW
ncbi:hypothetical protein RIF29_04872 [Crotalaria pallida]|uniref:Uncharacterized protein n=1 Tax=Crotalaria pallida TaxID=3830 RepID=A0AAN9J2H6_CROPI